MTWDQHAHPGGCLHLLLLAMQAFPHGLGKRKWIVRGVSLEIAAAGRLALGLRQLHGRFETWRIEGRQALQPS